MTKRRFLFLASVAFASNVASGAPATPAAVSEIAGTRAWLKLMHFERDIFFLRRSQADGPAFFVSPDGKKDPESELVATLKLLRSDDASRCRFPARWGYLKNFFPDLDRADFLDPCEGFRKFRDQIAAKSVTLVFSSYYLNAPASAFGHTFLRLNKAGHEAPDSVKRELLDSGLNFAAENTTDNPLLYPIFGMAGFFHGNFSRLPYYFKVREYGDFESRDLWEYNLLLTPAEVDLLVAHAWELGQTYFDYYFMTENCSYHMLTLIEAAAPRLRLTEKLPAWIIPSETIRVAFEEPGLVHSVVFRPSLRAVFFARARALSPSEMGWVKRLAIADNSDVIENFAASSAGRESRAKILEAAADFIDYKHPAKGLASGSQGEWGVAKLRLLNVRAKLGILPAFVVGVPEKEAPHLGHPSRRIGLGFHRSDEGSSVSLEARLALHDRFDPPAGYPAGSTLEFFKISARYFDRAKKLQLDELTILSASTLNSFGPFEQLPSWRMRLGTRREALWDCGDCRPFAFEFGTGLHFRLSDSGAWTSTALGETDLAISGSYRHSAAVYVGPFVEVARRAFDPCGMALSYRGRLRLNRGSAYSQRFAARFFRTSDRVTKSAANTDGNGVPKLRFGMTSGPSVSRTIFKHEW